jgi:hypothetical protein
MHGLLRNKRKLWWWRKPFPGNFGDILTPKIFDHFNIPWEFDKKNYDTISTGSIARYANKNTDVFGSGIISTTDQIEPSAKWHFARGPLTREKILECGGICPEIYGDPGLLLPLFCLESKKQYDTVLVPHFYDYKKVKELFPNYYVVDLLNDDPLITAKNITKGRSIISSSLHGIICAHAYNIPTAWVDFGCIMDGDNVKFKDYGMSVGIDIKQSTIKDPIFTNPSIDTKSIENIFKGYSYEKE